VLARRTVLATLVLAIAALVVRADAAEDKPITVFAAASMKNALDEVNGLFTARSGKKVMASYAASSALMKQIEQDARADVFLSADTDWMDYGVKQDLIKSSTRKDLLGNRLVLIAPKNSNIGKVNIAPDFDLAGLVGNGRIATGDVRAVQLARACRQHLIPEDDASFVWASSTPEDAFGVVRLSTGLPACLSGRLRLQRSGNVTFGRSCKLLFLAPPKHDHRDHHEGPDYGQC
jgi:Bacterial extracellular solute-binding protein